MSGHARHDASAASVLRLRVRGSGQELELAPSRLVVAGYTGSDPDTVAAHVAELQASGIAPPPETPMFYELSAGLLSMRPGIAVDGRLTSGEVEPVLFCQGGERYVGLGSDHTDRELEREDVTRSKAACPKPVASEVLPWEEAIRRWDRMTLRSRAGRGEELYQDGRTAQLRRVDELVDLYERRGGRTDDGLVLFLGTPPLEGTGFVHADHYRMELGVADGGLPIELAYNVLTAQETAAALSTPVGSVDGDGGAAVSGMPVAPGAASPDAAAGEEMGGRR